MLLKKISNLKYCLVRHSVALDKCKKQERDINLFIITFFVDLDVLKLKQYSSCSV